MTKKIDTGASARVPKMNISATRLNTTICPANIFANNLIISAKGLENNPIISTGIIIGSSHIGTPGGANTCVQYDLLPLNCMTINVQQASTNVIAMFPVTFAPKGGGNGISPIMLLIKIKKNAERRYGMYFSNL